ncbi:hypothetical protein GCM10009000_008540 [Halobacterium noricense]|uniref:Uncharacterized protein n=1 Tax=Haladaptatus pallidirubidus TaxID=1008152 RepID=A0AAV3UQJ8_9EURY
MAVNKYLVLIRKSTLHLLVEENVSARIVMALGSWSIYDAIESYLAAPTEVNIIESMSAVEL